jgi:hypothetical protein
MSDYVLTLLRGAYFGTLFGGFVFFLMREGGAPRRSFADDAGRRRHVLRNFGLFVSVVLIAEKRGLSPFFDFRRRNTSRTGDGTPARWSSPPARAGLHRPA